jgi:hypothetical protein
MRTVVFGLLLLGWPIVVSAGEPAVELKLVTASGVMAEDDFSGGELGPEWAAAKGKWEVVDGVLQGSELEADAHAAVLSLAVPNRDAVVQFDVKLGTAQGFNLSFNHAKGHLWRVYVSEEGLKLQKDKDKKDAASKTEVLATAEVALDAEKTYTVVAEFAGPAVIVRLADGSAEVGGSHPVLDTDKTGVRFVMRGEGLEIDNVKVWEATAKN